MSADKFTGVFNCDAVAQAGDPGYQVVSLEIIVFLSAKACRRGDSISPNNGRENARPRRFVTRV
jgi:hypothetical protein